MTALLSAALFSAIYFLQKRSQPEELYLFFEFLRGLKKPTDLIL